MIKMKNKMITITAILAVMVAMTGIAAAEQVKIYHGLPHDLANEVKTISLTIGGSAVGKDLVVSSFLQPAGEPHTLAYTVSDPDGAGPASPSDIELQFQELTTSVGPLAGAPYPWTQDAASDETLLVTFRATASAVQDETYQIQVTDLASGNSFTASAVVAATAIPEFPTVALPVAAAIGLVFFFQHKKRKEE